MSSRPLGINSQARDAIRAATNDTARDFALYACEDAHAAFWADDDLVRARLEGSAAGYLWRAKEAQCAPC